MAIRMSSGEVCWFGTSAERTGTSAAQVSFTYWFDTDTNIVYRYNGNQWIAESDDSTILELISAGETTLHTHPGGGEVNPVLVSQAEAEAGAETAARAFSPLRVFQAIAALETGETNPAAASQTEAEVGTEAALRSFSPLRVAQAIAALGGGGSGPVWTEVEIDLTNAEMLAMNGAGSPKLLVPAPGAGNVLDVLRTAFSLDNSAGVYVGGGNVNILCGGRTALVVPATFMTSDPNVKRMASGAIFAGVFDQINAPLFLLNENAAFTGGNAANKATVNVIYRVVPAAPN